MGKYRATGCEPRLAGGDVRVVIAVSTSRSRGLTRASGIFLPSRGSQLRWLRFRHAQLPRTPGNSISYSCRKMSKLSCLF